MINKLCRCWWMQKVYFINYIYQPWSLGNQYKSFQHEGVKEEYMPMNVMCGVVRVATVWRCDSVTVWQCVLTFHNFIFPAGWSDVLYCSGLTNYSTLSLHSSHCSAKTLTPLTSHLKHLLSSRDLITILSESRNKLKKPRATILWLCFIHLFPLHPFIRPSIAFLQQ